jgi:hypothetical protein
MARVAVGVFTSRRIAIPGTGRRQRRGNRLMAGYTGVAGPARFQRRSRMRPECPRLLSCPWDGYGHRCLRRPAIISGMPSACPWDCYARRYPAGPHGASRMPTACPWDRYACRYLPASTAPPECPRLARGIVTLAATRRPARRLPNAHGLPVGSSRGHPAAGGARGSSGEREAPTGEPRASERRAGRAAVAAIVRLPRASRGHPAGEPNGCSGDRDARGPARIRAACERV